MPSIARLLTRWYVARWRSDPHSTGRTARLSLQFHPDAWPARMGSCWTRELLREERMVRVSSKTHFADGGHFGFFQSEIKDGWSLALHIVADPEMKGYGQRNDCASVFVR